MASLNTLPFETLQLLGLSESDAKRLIAAREKNGPLKNFDELTAIELSREAQVRLREMLAAGLVDFRVAPPVKPGFEIALLPAPPIADIAPGKYKIGWTAADGSDRSAAGVFSFAGPNVEASRDITFKHPISVAVFDSGGRSLRELSFSPAEMMRRVDNGQFRATVEVRSLPLVLSEPRRFVRAGRYVVPTNPMQRFDGYRLTVAPLAAAGEAGIAALLGTPGQSPATGAVKLDASDPNIAAALSAFALSETQFGFEGSFLIHRPLEGDSSDWVGWIWLLSGPSLFFGLQRDDRLAEERRGITILLPTFALDTPVTDVVPFDAGETELLDRPDVFADDPGLNCKPFDNPGRILGERRFFSILRVSEPELGQPFEIARRPVGRSNEIEWEGDRTRLQARSVAIGHILEFRVRYRSNGYSLGNVAHSMTLAPRQTRRIVRVDFERSERAARRESTAVRDRVSQTTLSERSYSDAVQSELSEWSRGGSRSSVTAGAGGVGLALGPVVIGGGAAHSSATSSSWQDGGRSVAAAEQQNLRDAIRQYGDSLRELESSVVTEIAQEESVEGVSEVVRNINYCHALSVIYYEILRHLRIDTEIGGVRECLFVPLEVRPFTDTRLRRHRRVLARFAPDPDHRLALRHLDDILANFAGSEIPIGPRAAQRLTVLSGSVFLRMGITRPTEGEIADEIEEGANTELSQTKRFKELVKKLTPLAPFLGRAPTDIALTLLSISERDRDSYFQREVAPHLARAFVDRMQIGLQTGGSFLRLSADLTLASRYGYDRVVRVDFRIDPGVLRREQTTQLVFKAPPVAEFSVPERSFADVTQGRIAFSTAHYSRELRSNGSQRDDLLDPLTGAPTAEGGRLDFPLDAYETEVFRERLVAGLESLRKELDENIYRYHKLIWWNLDQDELYTLLDGFSVSQSDTRSLASVCERQPLGILGNSLVFRVAAGRGVDPNFASAQTLLSYYRDGLPSADPIRVSLPTSGLYARAHMDDCNACEEHQGSRDWVLSDPDPGLADLPATLLESRRAEVRDLGPSTLPDTLINLQNAPAAPAPTGLGGALGAVTNAGAFRDMAGLQGTQALATQGLTTAANLATTFGASATQIKLAELEADKTAGQKLSSVADAAQRAVQKGQMSEADAKTFVRDFANRLAGGGSAGSGGGTAGGSASLADKAKALASELGPRGSGTLVESGANGVSVASFDRSGKLAQMPGSSFNPDDPVIRALAKPGLKQQALDQAAAWTQQTAMRRVRLQTAGDDEYLFWADDPLNPDTTRLRDEMAKPGSGHARQADLLTRLEDYSRNVHPGGSNSFQKGHALDYADDVAFWSAAFISWLYSQAGLGLAQGFRSADNHSHFVLEALVNRLNRDYARPFWLFRPNEVEVAVGDILVKARGGQTLVWDEALLDVDSGKPTIRFQNGQWAWGGASFGSHSDMVLSFDATSGFVYTLGGNTEHLDGGMDTAGKRKYRLDASLHAVEQVFDALHPDVIAGTKAENSAVADQSLWAVVKLLDVDAFDECARLYAGSLDATDPDAFVIDTFLEVFGQPNAAGDLELPAATLTRLQSGGRGRAMFPASKRADFSDLDRRLMLKPVPQIIPPDLA